MEAILVAKAAPLIIAAGTAVVVATAALLYEIDSENRTEENTQRGNSIL